MNTKRQQKHTTQEATARTPPNVPTGKYQSVSLTDTEYHHKHLIPTVKHSERYVMIWACFAGPVKPAVKSIIHSSLYRNTLDTNETPSV